MIKFHDGAGETMFAFALDTDPLDVLVELCWAYTRGQSICELGYACPHPDGYCCDCHDVAYAARKEAERRLIRVSEGSTG